MKKSFLSILLALCMTLAVPPVRAGAAGDTIDKVVYRDGAAAVWISGNSGGDRVLAVAAYTAGRQMLSCAEKNVTAEELAAGPVTVEIAAAGAAYVMAYLLEGGTLRPVCAKRSAAAAEGFADAAALSPYYAMADVHRREILNSKTSIVKSDTFIPGETYTGTAYYVSSSEGDDSNDGLSPERPWKTLRRVHQGEWDGDIYRPGDAVFFKRGDVWRENLWCKEGVTFSAYGEGPKPVLMGSPESGVGEEKWAPCYEDASGKKIWKFYKDMNDTGGIVFNEGESYAPRAYGWWDGGKYINVDFVPDQTESYLAYLSGVKIVTDGKEQRPEECLDDLQMCIMVDYTGQQFPVPEQGKADCKGPLYLRCDRGNPGTVFQSVEFASKHDDYPFIVICKPGCVIDNLSVKYWGAMGIGAGPEMENVVVQNCEVAWGLSTINSYIQPEPTIEYMLINDAIYGVSYNGTVRNNYTHDMDASGVTFETFTGDEPNTGEGDVQAPSDPPEFLRCTGNLIERCGCGIVFTDQGGWFSYKEIEVSDNYILDTASKNFDGKVPFLTASLSLGHAGFPRAERFDVTGNVFCRSTRYMLLHANPESYPVNFSRNVYIQDAGALFALYPEWNFEVWRTTDADLWEKLAESISAEPETLLIAVD